jgi:hypothetical protein
MMDNFHIDVTSVGETSLLKALELAFAHHRQATHYAVRDAEPATERVPYKPRRLVFLWTAATQLGTQELPFKLDAAGAVEFARRWLNEQDFGREPDHDGDNKRGWRVYNEAWGRVDNQYQGFIAIAPAWAMYGK